jgi:TatA/E family protein of Tat protein translocase
MFAILGLGSGELIVILVVVLILFGAKRIPEFAKGLGKGINEFKKASREVTEEIHNAGNETPAPTPKAPANTAPQSAPANPSETKVG